MLRPRIIPCLLVRDKGLVKTIGFSTPTYVGDPINAVKIFNDKEVDELIFLDIASTTASAPLSRVDPNDFSILDLILSFFASNIAAIAALCHIISANFSIS